MAFASLFTEGHALPVLSAKVARSQHVARTPRTRSDSAMALLYCNGRDGVLKIVLGITFTALLPESGATTHRASQTGRRCCG